MLKKIFLLSLLLWSIASYAQPGYTRINSRYNWLAGMFDGLNVPAGGAPAFQVGQNRRAGAIYYDSTGVDSGLYVWTGLIWKKAGGSTVVVGSGLASSGDTLSIRATLYDSLTTVLGLRFGVQDTIGTTRRVRIGSPFKMGQQVDMLVFSNVNSDSSFTTATQSYSRADNYGKPMVIMEKRFNELWGDTLLTQYGGIHKLTYQQKHDPNSTRYNDEPGKSISIAEAGIVMTNSFHPPTHRTIVQTSPFGFNGSGLQNNFSVGGSTGYDIHIAHTSNSFNYGLGGIVAKIDLQGEITSARKRLTGVPVSAFQGEWKFAQQAISSGLADSSYVDSLIIFRGYGSVYSSFAATKDSILKKFMVKRAFVNYVDPQWRPNNEVANGYPYVAVGDSDYNHFKGFLRIGGNTPDRLVNDRPQAKLEAYSAGAQRAVSIIADYGHLTLQSRAAGESYPGFNIRSHTGAYLGGVGFNVQFPRLYFDVNNTSAPVTFDFAGVTKVGFGNTSATFSVPVTIPYISNSSDSTELAVNSGWVKRVLASYTGGGGGSATVTGTPNTLGYFGPSGGFRQDATWMATDSTNKRLSFNGGPYDNSTIRMSIGAINSDHRIQINGNSGFQLLFNNNGNKVIVGGTSGGDFAVSSGGGTRLATVTNAGWVGTGAVTPSQSLDVEGNARIRQALMPNNVAGTTGQLLTGAGANTANTWTTVSTGLTWSGGNLTNDLRTGISGSQSIIGSTTANGGMIYRATASGVTGNTGTTAAHIFNVGDLSGINPVTIYHNGTTNFSAPVSYTNTTLTDATTTTYTMTTGMMATWTMAGNRTFAVASPVINAPFTIIIKQDATGNRLITWPASFRFQGGVKLLSTAANSVDVLTGFYDGTNYYVSLTKGYVP